ncbi:MAG TPA: saccharopine dehydrogenase C-terminal domain-containing protein, partial [Bacteroidales bacterium]|nr:saccharopine dehydrogenase C-terminal domain-containing protein [Bacteroidales bacterium]
MQNSIRIIIASPMKGRADELLAGNELGASVDWSMDDRETLDLMIRESDLTVSLLPYKYHAAVARACLMNRKPLVTTSYVQEEIKALHGDVKKAGLIFLNEVGLDPGIDHMSAMKLIDRIHSRGGEVEQFYSLCGALPAPEAIDNPMGYKFSWSPKGVVLAGLNSAHYLRNGEEIHIDTSDLFKDTFKTGFPGVGELEVYPNRDSMSYMEIYGIPEVQTIYRGTFRSPGWCETMDAMKRFGMLSDKVADYSGQTYSDFLSRMTGVPAGDLRNGVMELLKVSEESAIMRSFDFLGFFSDEKLSYYETTPFEITSDRMISKMMLRDDERDMVILRHDILALWPDGRKEVIRSQMTDYGSPSSNTAIASTVALPASIAVKLILNGQIRTTGVMRPVVAEIYNPVLEELKTLGIEMQEEYGLPEEELM